MFLTTLPPLISTAVLVALGAFSGSMINWAIYRWGEEKWLFSPWSPKHEKATSRTVLDRIPIVGWLMMRRDANVHGAGFWVRPLLIEIVWAVGLPWFFFWQLDGGLTGALPKPLPTNWELWAETWFWGHSILIALMFIATFIDFDQKLIPDSITIPGTLIALAFAAVAPWFRFPVVTNVLGSDSVEPLGFWAAEAIPNWHHSTWGLVLGLFVVTAWVYALYPKYPASTLKCFLAGFCRILRGNKRGRRVNAARRQAIVLLFVLAAGLTAVAMTWTLNRNTVLWDSMAGAILGLTGGWIIVWSIRVIGNITMGREAMGFGDVTLLGMVGAFLGWHASLLIFFFAPFAALVIALAQLILLRKTALAFGPYLCLAALMLILWWQPTWNWAKSGLFSDLRTLFIMAGVYLVALGGTLALLQVVKRIMGGPEPAESTVT